MAEYQVCATRADFHTNLIWSWGAALVGINAAGIGVLAQADQYLAGRFLLVVLLAAAASFLMLWWNLAADRWHVNIHVSYVRLQDIEKLLGMKHNVYIGIHNQDFIPCDEPNHDLQKRLRKSTGYPERGSLRLIELRSLLNAAVPLIWILVVFVEALAFVTEGKPCLVCWARNCEPLDFPQHALIIVFWIVGCIPLALTAWYLRKTEKSSRDAINSKRPRSSQMRGNQAV